MLYCFEFVVFGQATLQSVALPYCASIHSMAEYQYYEFRALDRPLRAEEQAALRSISTRARITPRLFVNEYNWGDLKGDPQVFMQQWFDLHLYLANWGTRRFMVRLPKRLVDRTRLESFVCASDFLTISETDDHVILDLWDDGELHEDEVYYEGESSWMDELAPLHQELLSGDLSALYLAWLAQVASGVMPDEAKEPLPGIDPLSDAAKTLSIFFQIDSGLIEAAVHENSTSQPSTSELQAAVQSLPRVEVDALLIRLATGDPHAGAGLRRLIVKKTMPERSGQKRRTVAQLRVKAEKIWTARKVAAAKEEEAERKRRERLEAEALERRLGHLKKLGEAVWDEVEENIQLTSAKGYNKAAALLDDLRALAEKEEETAKYWERMAQLRIFHARRMRFIDRLNVRGLR